MDYYSKFLEILRLRELTSSEVIRNLEIVFARYGIPEILFTDNGTQLTSREIKEFANQADFTIITRSPAYPQANSQAEAGVKIAKKILSNEQPWIALMNYRSTPTSLGYRPSEMLMNRKIRTRIPEFSLETKVPRKAVFQNHQKRRQQMERQFNQSRGAVDLPELQPGTLVLVEDLNQRGTVVRKHTEPRSYDIRLNNGGIFRRNRKGLRALPTVMLDIPVENPTPQSTPVSTAPSTPARSTPRSSLSPQPTKTPVIPYSTRSGRITKAPLDYSK